MARLFVAVWPPVEVRAALSALDRPAFAGVRWSVPEQWMVSVRPLGYVADEVVPPLIEVLHWKPFLDGEISRDEAVARTVVAVGS